MSSITQTRGTVNVLAVTALANLADSATVGWKSVAVDNTSTGAIDYEIFVKLTMANSAPAAPKAAYVYICPAYYDGSTWYYTDGGTATLPSSADAGYTIATPNDLRLGMILNYTTQQMVLQGSFTLSSIFGQTMPDGFIIIIVNDTGAAVAASGNVVAVTPITLTIT